MLEDLEGEGVAVNLLDGGLASELGEEGGGVQFGGEALGIDVDADAENDGGAAGGGGGLGEEAAGFLVAEVDVVGPLDLRGQRELCLNGLTEGERGEGGDAWPVGDGGAGPQEEGEEEIPPGLGLPAVFAASAPAGLDLCKDDVGTGGAGLGTLAQPIAGGGGLG